MKTRVNLNYQLLFQCIVLSVFTVSMVSIWFYLTYLLLSVLFASPAVFFSLFGLAAGLGVLFTYDADAFQWNNNPRIAIRREREVKEL